MRDSISGKTKICGLIGDPVEHSMSPAMHNAAFREMGIDYLYATFRVRSEELGKAIEAEANAHEDYMNAKDEVGILERINRNG